MEAETVYRYRLAFRKKRPVKYVGHLDTITTWARAFRRARIPLAYSKGFNPRARIQVAGSLPLGYMSREELMDVYLTEELAAAEFVRRVGNTLPAGFELLAAEPIPPKSPAMQSQLKQADYRVTVETDLPPEILRKRIERLLAAEQVIQTRIRRRKEEAYDLRPLLHHLELEAVKDRDAILRMRLATGQSGHLRPEAVLKALGLDGGWYEVERLKLFLAS